MRTKITPAILRKQYGGARIPLLGDSGWAIGKFDVGWGNVKQMVNMSGKVSMAYLNDKGASFVRTAYDWSDTGLELCKTTLKGYKRMTRFLRPVYFGYMGARNTVDIRVDNTLDEKLWDGIALIHPRVIDMMEVYGNDPETIKARRKRLHQCKRFSLTVAHEEGQLKGHVFVCPDLDCDILISGDAVKKEVRLTNGNIFVSLEPVKGKISTEDHFGINLDFQTLMNTSKFFLPEYGRKEDEYHFSNGDEIDLDMFDLDDLEIDFSDTSPGHIENQPMIMQWLEQQTARFMALLESGDINAMLDSIDSIDTADDLERLRNWTLAEYVTRGGDVRQFSWMIKQAARSYLLKLVNTNIGKYRVPVPGERLYIATVNAAHRAGFNEIQIAKGSVYLDYARATMWVHDEDWSTAAQVWGGGDQDDSVIIMVFQDYDGLTKVWSARNPNEFGEYMVMNLGGCDHDPIIIELDSRNLPRRIDQQQREYVVSKADLEAGSHETSFESNLKTIIRNTGVLGRYVNYLMTYACVNNGHPTPMVAPLELVVDGTVKDGYDLSMVLEVLKGQVDVFVRENAIPTELVGRIQSMTEETITESSDDWLSRFVGDLRAHVSYFEARVALLCRTMPYTINSEALTRLTGLGKQHMELGRSWTLAYREYLKVCRTEEDQIDFMVVHQKTEEWLNQFPSDQHLNIWYGAFAHAYLTGENSIGTISDSILWALPQLGFEALYMAGLIGDVHIENKRVQNVLPVTEAGEHHAIVFEHGWFNWAVHELGYVAKRQSDIPDRELLKQRWAEHVSTITELTITKKTDSKKRQRGFVYHNSKLIGMTRPGAQFPEGKIRITSILADVLEGDTMAVGFKIA